MSLKAFHLVFISASTLLAFGFGVWSLMGYFSATGAAADLVLGLCSLGCGVALILYGRYVFRKLKHVSYL